MLFVELAMPLLCIVIGARLGGIALGTVSGIGLLIFVLIFGMPPGHPPAVVLGMILAVITALSMMEAAGGLDFLVETAEKLLHRNPRRITIVAPLVTYVLIFLAGTQHVIYSLLPVIAEVSRKAGVRPERPLSMSVIAAQQGLVASPVSAATVALVAALAGLDVLASMPALNVTSERPMLEMASKRPGVTGRPSASMTFASTGTASPRPSAVIRPSSMISVPPSMVPSVTV